MKKFEAGFIGAGNMGGALATAAAKQVTGERVAVACSSPAHSAAAAERLGCRAAAPEEILGGSKFVFLGVKPQMIDGVVQSLAAPIAASESIFVSMLAGVQLERLERLLGADKKIIRILPNTACAVGQGVVLYCANGNVTDGDLAAFCALMAAAGIVDPISEALIDAGCAITGCGPAFAYMFIEALADGGVKCGLPRAKAIRYTAQMLAGSAEMVLQSGKHPEQLKDEVCSPGGSTIAGVDALEQHGFRGSCIAAVDAAFEKTRPLHGCLCRRDVALLGFLLCMDQQQPRLLIVVGVDLINGVAQRVEEGEVQFLEVHGDLLFVLRICGFRRVFRSLRCAV